jgi:hypothetical protein
MGDLRKRMASVRTRRFKPHGWVFDGPAYEALKRAKDFFGTDSMLALATAMAEVLFPGEGRGRKRGSKTWDDNKHLQLAFAYFELKSEHPRLKDVKIAEIISRDPNFKEYHNNHELLRQRLGKAKRQYGLWGGDQAAEMAKLGVEPDIIEKVQNHFDRRRGAKRDEL